MVEPKQNAWEERIHQEEKISLIHETEGKKIRRIITSDVGKMQNQRQVRL